MSWDAYLIDDRGHTEFEVNYTHNCNRMIAAAILATEGTHVPTGDHPINKVIGPSWWDRLDEATGKEGAEYLTLIIDGLKADPQRYRAMNPPNGWGSYDQLLEILTSMRDAVPEWPCAWHVSG